MAWLPEGVLLLGLLLLGLLLLGLLLPLGVLVLRKLLLALLTPFFLPDFPLRAGVAGGGMSSLAVFFVPCNDKFKTMHLWFTCDQLTLFPSSELSLLLLLLLLMVNLFPGL